MTNQEAINNFKIVNKRWLEDENMYSNTMKIEIDDEFIKTIDKGIEALEKQIPKELTNIRKVKRHDGYDMGNCPICGEPLDNSFYENLKYCFVCGQAIKWE